MATRIRSTKKSSDPSKDAAIHFVAGSDEGEVKKKARELAAALAPSDDPFATEVIDGNVANADEAVQRLASVTEALLTVPFFGSKLVWLKNATFFADTVTGRSEAVAGATDSFLATVDAGLPDGVKLLVSAPEADKRRSAYKRLSKAGALHLCDRPDFGWNATEADVVDWVADRVRARGLSMGRDAVEVLAARVGTESRQLDQELEKLFLAFNEGHSITERDVRQLVAATRTGGIFDLSNALAKRDLELCLASLETLFRQGERAVGILLAAIVPTIRNLLVVKDLMQAHGITPPAEARYFSGTLNRLPAHATAHLPRKKDGTINAYALGIAAANSRRYSLAELESAFHACAAANRALVTSSLDESVVLSKLIVQIAAAP